MKEFRINEYLSVKLEDNKTQIYVAGERFMQCAALLFHLPVKDLNYFEGITSIDDAQLNFEKIYDETGLAMGEDIPPEEEFWGHCSNLQAWYEHGYDTRLLHSNLAFPLLKKLSEAGDEQAKHMFFEEIIYRYKNGNLFTRRFLSEEQFLNLLPIDMLLHLYLDSDEEVMALFDLWEEVEKGISEEYKKYKTFEDFIYESSGESFNYFDNYRYVRELNLSRYTLDKFPEAILQFKRLKELNLTGVGITYIPRKIYRLKELKSLDLDSNKLKTLPISICSMENLEYLSIRKNQLECLPQNIGNLKKLKELNLRENNLKRFPDSIGDFKSLEKLYLSNNNISELPESIGNLKNLKSLDISNNNLKTLPDSIYELNNLNHLDIRGNNFDISPNIRERMDFLKEPRE
ncbi:MAG: leucine-rich repeat domain-containing protein [Candidatus Lokiarchaeota archaeon]|nr:leucine-rich repeat domain-containing protein [Candidatus Lokiarchaeota archaeon]